MANQKPPNPRPNPAKGSMLAKANAPTAPSPWPLEGIRPYGGPQQVHGQPPFAPKGK